MKQPDNVGSFSMDVLIFFDFCLMDILEIWIFLIDILEILDFFDGSPGNFGFFDGYLPVFFTPFKSSSK